MDDTFAVVSSKGQIVIPAALRQKLGIKTGTRLAIRSEENQSILQPITEEFAASSGAARARTRWWKPASVSIEWRSDRGLRPRRQRTGPSLRDLNHFFHFSQR
jgi:AbrB family looped-hinge helix DNA binding protein